MSAAEREARSAELKQKLSEVEARFRVEAQRRGFEPTQVENMALPAPLANLFADCVAIRSELEELEERKGER
jgi:hypothetical protein